MAINLQFARGKDKVPSALVALVTTTYLRNAQNEVPNIRLKLKAPLLIIKPV